jgi:hypothetical protein
MRLIPLLLLALAGPASAQSPDDFAWQWPIVADGDEGAHTLVLDETVYARITRADLRDLAVVNADGQPVPFAPLPWRRTTQDARTQLNWLRLPVATSSQGESLSLRIERDDDGTVRDLQLDSAAAAATTASTDLLVDLGDDPETVASLRVTLGDDAELPVNLRVQVLASDDLATWRSLGTGLALVAIDDNGLRIERLRLDFAPSHERYLRLSLAPGGDWPPLARLEHERRETGSDQPDLRTVDVEGRPVPGETGMFEYTGPGPLPVSRVDLALASGNTVAGVQVLSRDDADDDTLDERTPYWSPAAEFTAFRLGSGANEVRHLPADVDGIRDRLWRVRTTPALTQAPTLRLSYRPDRFVLLAQGAPPYRLLAGSVRATRPDYPVQAALAAAGAAQPAGWVPPAATLGEGVPAAGDSALHADRGPDYRRWALWSVLAIGALLVLVMSLRVLRHPPPAE